MKELNWKANSMNASTRLCNRRSMTNTTKTKPATTTDNPIITKGGLASKRSKWTIPIQRHRTSCRSLLRVNRMDNPTEMMMGAVITKIQTTTWMITQTTMMTMRCLWRNNLRMPTKWFAIYKITSRSVAWMTTKTCRVGMKHPSKMSVPTLKSIASWRSNLMTWTERKIG